MPSESKEFTKDVFLVGLSNVLVKFRGIISLPIISKTLATADYGIWAQVSVTIAFLTPLITIGLPFGLVRFLAVEDDQKKIQEDLYSILLIIFIIGFFASTIFFVFSGAIGSLLAFNNTTIVRLLGAIILLDSLNLVWLNLFRALKQIKRYVFFTLIQSFGELLLIGIAVVLGYRLIGVIFCVLLIRIITFFIMGFLIVKKVGLGFPRFTRTREYLSFSVPTIAGNISNWIVRSSDRYLIGGFLGIIFVAYYSPSYQLGEVITMFLAPLNFVLPVFLAKFYDQGNFDQVKRYLQFSFKYFMVLAIPAAFGMSIIAKNLLILLSTKEIALNGYMVTPFILASMILLGGKSIVSQIFIIVKRTKLNASVWISGAIMNILLNLYFIPKFGIIGAAITTFIAYATTLILAWYLSRKFIFLLIDWKFIIKTFLAAIVMSAVLYLINPIGAFWMVISITVAAAVYFLLLLLMHTFSREEFIFFRQLFRFRR